MPNNNKLHRHLALLALALALASTHAFHVQKLSTSSLARQSVASLPMAGESPEGSLLDRVLRPKIDDRGLPLSDASAAQVIGPALQVFWLTLAGAPRPTWLIPHYDTTFVQYRGALLVPTLLHGAALSCCWLLGALMARAYEEDAIDPTVQGYPTVFWRIFQAGCFASGVLIFSTQIDLLVEFGRYVQPGESPEIDARIITAWVEVLNDIIFEVLAIVPLRLYLAASIAKNK